MKKINDEIELKKPTLEYKKQIQEYLNEHIENNEKFIYGSGGLHKFDNIDLWFEKVTSTKVEEGKIPASQYLAIRKSDDKLIGMVNIRHKLNEKLLQHSGNIGDGVRPSERSKGYATEMVRLALKEIKKFDVNRVLMTCDKDNIASAETIIKNGGMLENEVLDVNGQIVQRYWINLKKKYANNMSRSENPGEIYQKCVTFDNDDFKGDVFLNKFVKLPKKSVMSNGVVFKADNYRWITFFDYSKKSCLTALYDDKNEIIEWYFDIARFIGKENGIPFEDDIYLDVVMDYDGRVRIIDEDEIQEALEKLEITKKEYDEAYEVAKEIVAKITGKREELKKFTDKYLKIMLEK